MLGKIKALLGSIRFWMITLTGIVAILDQVVTGGVSTAFFFKTVELWLGAIIALGTFDSIATKFGAARRAQ